MTFDYVLYDMSFANFMLYGAVIPSTDYDRDGKDDSREEVIRVDDPKNRDMVMQLISNMR